jgi:drug/metabolite transporter (DMT)-like permease
MASILCGLAAALQWGTSTTAIAGIAGRISARRFGFWFSFIQALAVLIPGIIVGVGSRWAATAVTMLVAAAALQGIALMTLRVSVAREQLAVVAPLVGLEGAVAAIIAVIAGEPLPLATAVGLILAVIGGWLVGASRSTYRLSVGSVYALITGVLFGSSLWLLARSNVEPLVALLIFNGLATIPFVGRLNRTEGQAARPVTPSGREILWLLVAALTSIGGQLAFVVGVRAGAGAVTAVLSAQSAVIAMFLGYLLFHERLGARQLGGCAVLMVGVSLIALSTG